MLYINIELRAVTIKIRNLQTSLSRTRNSSSWTNIKFAIVKLSKRTTIKTVFFQFAPKKVQKIRFLIKPTQTEITLYINLNSAFTHEMVFNIKLLYPLILFYKLVKKNFRLAHHLLPTGFDCGRHIEMRTSVARRDSFYTAAALLGLSSCGMSRVVATASRKCRGNGWRAII